MNFIEVAWKIRPILETMPSSRDSDRVLIAEVWKREIENLPKEVSGTHVFDLLVNGLIENPETITRVRRKLQETIETLRGEKWTSRHNMESECCRQLTFFDMWNY